MLVSSFMKATVTPGVSTNALADLKPEVEAAIKLGGVSFPGDTSSDIYRAKELFNVCWGPR